MAARILPILFILTPLIVLFSGMAMAPLLILVWLLLLLSTPRSALRNPSMLYPRWKHLVLGLGLLTAPTLASALWSINPALSLDAALRVLGICCFGAFLFIYVRTLPTPSDKMLRYYGGILVFISLLVLQEVLLKGGIIQYIYDHANISYERFMHKNINRGLCALTLMIWPFLLACHERGNARKGWLVMGILFLAIMSMHSLSAKVGLISSIIAFFTFKRFPITIPLVAFIVPFFLLAFPIFYTLAEPAILSNAFILSHLPESSIHRLHIWQIMLQEIHERPILGWGMNATRILPLSAEQLTSIHLDAPPLHPHNTSLQLLVEEGIIGLLMSVAAITVLLREWVKMPKEESFYRTGAGALIVAYIVTGVSSFGIWQNWWMASLCLAAAFWRWMSIKRPAAI